MHAIDHVDPGTPPSRQSSKLVTLEIDGVAVTVPEGTRSCAPRRCSATQIPKLCATDTLKAFGSCRLCLVEIDGRSGYPGLVHDARRRRHEGPHGERRSSTQLRTNVMELYISDHPLDCESCPANGQCELQDMAERARRHRDPLRLRRHEPTSSTRRRTTAIRTSRSIRDALHRLLALRARVRRECRARSR